ncbi:MAG: acyltransferase domain-containing protein, partial [Actinomycetota bacterium]|nr:acyltransferase domain-containing protein [Actinomycetota bacterium]
LTAPNGPSQQRVIERALANARLTGAQVDLLEAHGTGTTLGDPIEAHALLATYGQTRPADRPLRLGSIKSNIGHTQAAAGVAGVIKAVMAVRHGVLPRTLHVDAPTPEVDWAAGGLSLLTETLPWPETGEPRRAAVSAFGGSGTNAHAIIEQAPEPVAEQVSEPPAEPVALPVLPWVLSARGEPALRAQAARLHEFATADPALSAADLALSLVATRASFGHRAVVLGEDRASLLDGLAALAGSLPSAQLITPKVPVTADGSAQRPVFVFPGQGSQWVGMALGLLDSVPVFAESIAECEQALSAFVDWSLTEVLRGTAGSPSLERVDVVQPVLWAVMVSLAAVWRSFGIRPAAVVGHSQGEIAAAVVAGGLSLADGAKVVALRSLALLELAGQGGMVSIALPVAEVEQRLADWKLDLSIATVNGPAATVVSGAVTPLETLLKLCEQHEIRARRIRVDYASHSVQVETIQARLLKDLAGIQPVSGSVPFYSTVTGELFDTAGLNPEYWYTNLRETVRFHDTVQALVAEGHTVFIEASPHPVLVPAISDTSEQHLSTLGTLRRDEGGVARLIASLAEAHVHGLDIDWRALLAGTGARTVDLPTYPFQRERYWLDSFAADAGQPLPVLDEVEARFWEAVEQEDLEALTDTLALDGEGEDLDEDGSTEVWEQVLPTLSAWRRRRTQNATVDSWRYRINWQPLDIAGRPDLAGNWLLITSEADTGSEHAVRAAAGLRGHGATVVPLAIDATRCGRDEVARLLREAIADGPLAGVLSLLALDQAAHPAEPVISVGLAGTLALVQAVEDAGVDAPLWCATSLAISVSDDELLANPGQTPVWGLGRVVALEQPRRWGGLIDLPADWDEKVQLGLCQALAGSGEDQLAVRTEGVYGRRLVRPELAARPETGWQPRDTAVVVGGGIPAGRVVRWLTENEAARVVLVGGASGLPEPADGEDWAGRVSIADGGVDGLAEVLRSSAELGLPVRSLFVLDEDGQLASVADTELADLADAVRGRVLAAEAVAQLAGLDELDAVVFFTSVTGVWGAGEHAAYAAASTQVDAISRQLRWRGVPAISVAWPIWDEVLAAADEAVASVLQRPGRQGLPLLDSDLALVVLDRLLAADVTSAVIAEVDWERFVPLFTSVRNSPLLQGVSEANAVLSAGSERRSGESSEAAVALHNRLAAVAEVDRPRIVVELVRGHAAAALGHTGVAEIGPSRPFKELGFDSLIAVELRNRLNAATGLRLPSTLVFDYPTSAALADYLLGRLSADLPGSLESIRRQLDQLAGTLSVLEPDDDGHSSITSQLQGLMTSWQGSRPEPAGAESVVDVLDSATDEEMLAFIQREFGGPSAR